MLTITNPEPNRVDIEFAGVLDAQAMEAGLDDLFRYTETMQNGRMLYRIPDFALPTFGAIGVKMGHMSQLFKLLGKVDRCALMTDSAWLRTAAEIEGALFPGIDIKSFKLDETDAAEAWLAQTKSAAA